jgi:regulatory protein
VRITKIENQKKRPGRKNLYADGKFLAGVSAETLLKLALRTGDEIGPAQLKVLQETESLHSARSTALRFLSARPRTEREVRGKLRQKEFSDDEIDATLNDLRMTRLLDDREFVRAFVRNALTLRPVGKAALRRKLLLLGVDKGVVDEEVEIELRDTDQEALATTLAKQFVRKARSTRTNEPIDKLRNRLAGFLGRRGFSWDVIMAAMRAAVRNNE